MRVLFLAPLPPPVTGHSLISKILLDALAERHRVDPVDLSVGSQHDGSVSARRIKEVAKAVSATARNKRDADVIYLTISETLAGNLKDLAIYLACGHRLKNMVVHLHGGSIGRLLFESWPIIKRVNAFFLRRMAAVIISGPAHRSIFEDAVAPERLPVVFNFAPDDLLVDEDVLAGKFAAVDRLKVLYLSGMAAEKGSHDLLDAYALLEPAERAKMQLDFAGRFDSDADRAQFLERIAGMSGVSYHGIVDDARKRQLFADSHVFCLPSSMFEGQPISILEAYASGCVVIASRQPGIRDIFTDGANGFEVTPGDPPSIAAALRKALAANDLADIAAHNRESAVQRYTRERYVDEMEDILLRAAAR